MRIALLYNEPLPSRYNSVGEEHAIAAIMEAVEAIQVALVSNGHVIRLLGLRPPLTRATATLMQVDTELVFNLFEGFEGRSETEWHVAKTLETLGCPFTGASAATLALCLNKAKTKQLLTAHGIATSPFQLLRSGTVERFSLDFPVIVKPLQEDGSHGMSSQSVVYDTEALAKQVGYIEATHGGPVLVERFLPGREFNASILAYGPPRVLPPSEVVFSEEMPEPQILTYASKWRPQDPTYRAAMPVCPPQVPQALRQEIEDLALAAYEAVGAPPYARVDLRGDAQGHLFVLEVNPNADLSPDAGMALQARAAGLTYEELIETVVNLAVKESRLGGRYASAAAI
jgi:D-alanine-D-alanine ligase